MEKTIFVQILNQTFMKLKHLFVAAVLFVTSAAAVMAQGMQLPPIPVDNAVRMGKLPNGLTYYIRHNGYPEHRVNFYIAQRVGSIQEEEDQRGLAHFLEHMAFNGSDNYPGDRLIEYLRSIGVEFGSDLNAYTAVDQTVYRVCNVPSDNIASLDSCLLILKDWSNGLTLDAKEIDKERGVIHEEWRLRSSAGQRMLERNLEKLYPGSKYGRRMPIGTMEVIDNFKPEVLRAYYHKWYRPDNQAVIVVGDVDVDRTEQKIKEMFSGIKMPENAVPVVDEPVPDNNEAIIIIDKDKEQRQDVVQLMFKHEAVPDSMKSNMFYLIQQYAVSLCTSMLNSRLSEVQQNPDCPFAAAYVYDGEYIYSKTKDAFNLIIIPKPGKTEEAVKAAMREVMRAAKFGYTATEYVRAKDEYMSWLEKIYTNRDKQENSFWGDQYRDHFLSNEPIPSIEDQYTTMQQITPMLPVDLANEMVKELVSVTDTNLVVYGTYTEKEGAVYPAPEAIKAAIDAVHGEQLTAWVDNVKNEPLIKELPKKGSIVSEKENAALGYKELTLSNGARVFLKKTDFKDDEVVMSASSKGGSSLLPESDISNAKLYDMAISASGLGNFSNTELEKALAGKQASVNLTLNNLHEGASGRSTPKDLETMFQLTYLYFTNVTKDEKSYNALMTMLESTLKNQDLSPEKAFSDSLVATLYSHNPRFESLQVEDLKKANYDRILQIAKERTANAGDYTFTFVGNFDEATIRPLIEQYIASLPANGVKEEWKPVSSYAKGNIENKFTRKMETPKANSYIYWYNLNVPYTQENAVAADAAGQILGMVYLKAIREDASAAYSTGAAGFVNLGGDTPFSAIVGVCPMKPEMCDVALKIMNDEARKMCTTVDAEKLVKVKELMLKRADENAKTNGYWVNAIENFDEYGIDTVTKYKDVINALTPEKVAKFMKDVIFTNGNSVTVVMLPETEKK